MAIIAIFDPPNKPALVVGRRVKKDSTLVSVRSVGSNLSESPGVRSLMQGRVITIDRLVGAAFC